MRARPRPHRPAPHRIGSVMLVSCALAAGCASTTNEPLTPERSSRTASRKPTPQDERRLAREREEQRQQARRRAQTRRIAEADRQNRKGNHETALEILTSVVEESPERTDALLRLGNTRLFLDDAQGALLAFETAYHLGAKTPKLPRSIAELWLTIGEIDAGLEWLGRAREASPDDPELRLREAQVLLVAERSEEARTLAEGLLVSEDEAVVQSAHVLLGYAAMSEGDEERAVTHWEAAARRRLARKDILSFLGERRYAEGRYAEASRYFEAAVDVADDETVHRRLVRSLVRSGQLARAKEEILRYLEKYPDSKHREEVAASAIDG